MEISENTIESLLVRAEEYGKTSIDLLKLKYTEKASDTVSESLFHLLLSVFRLLLIITLSIASALFIGKQLGENYYGFLWVAVFYAVILIIVYSLKSSIKRYLKNKTINLLLN